MPAIQQTIRYLTARDGTRLAWAVSGTGPALVKASNWITHLEYDWTSPVWKHWMHFFSAHFTAIRYDERGCGLSQRDPDNVSPANWMTDLEDVIKLGQPRAPFVLLGISQGACAAISYAVKYPENVSHLVIYGGYTKGWAQHDNANLLREGNALVDFTELGWGRPDPLYRRLFTKRFLPKASEEQLSWFDELCSNTTSPHMAAQLLRSRGQANVHNLLGDIRVPTLVVHADKDGIAPLTGGQEMAAGIPGAQFVQLESCNHILLESEPAWQRFTQAVLDFTGVEAQSEDAIFNTLSDRERDILEQICAGLTNVEVGKTLFISEKTVRNHLTRIFEKLGVGTRAQAIVFARDHGFVSRVVAGSDLRK
jgi:pimeloyl-ACP methyl ester carboxylesterase/DNA-binding CsgD family transcriptional regulator